MACCTLGVFLCGFPILTMDASFWREVLVSFCTGSHNPSFITVYFYNSDLFPLLCTHSFTYHLRICFCLINLFVNILLMHTMLCLFILFFYFKIYSTSFETAQFLMCLPLALNSWSRFQNKPIKIVLIHAWCVVHYYKHNQRRFWCLEEPLNSCTVKQCWARVRASLGNSYRNMESLLVL